MRRASRGPRPVHRHELVRAWVRRGSGRVHRGLLRLVVRGRWRLRLLVRLRMSRRVRLGVWWRVRLLIAVIAAAAATSRGRGRRSQRLEVDGRSRLPVCVQRFVAFAHELGIVWNVVSFTATGAAGEETYAGRTHCTRSGHRPDLDAILASHECYTSDTCPAG